MAFSPDGKVLAVGLNVPTALAEQGLAPLIRLWDLDKGKELRFCLGHKRAVNYLAFTPDGKFLPSGGSDNTFRLWNVQTAKEVRRFELSRDSDCCGALSPDGTRLVTWSSAPLGKGNTKLQVWDVSTGRSLHVFDGTKMHVRRIVVSPNKRHAVLQGQHSLEDSSALKVFDLFSGKVVRSFDGVKDYWLPPAAVSPSGNRLFLDEVDVGGKITDQKAFHVLWDVTNNNEVKRFRKGSNASPLSELRDRVTVWVSWCPDGTHVLLRDHGNRLRLLNVVTGNEVWAVTDGAEVPALVDKGKRALLGFSRGGLYRVEFGYRCRDLASGKLLREGKFSIVP
jgi:WD40 repeat protein